MALGDAAQRVQVSAFPERYAMREREARQIAAAAGIDLHRAGNPYAGRAGAPPTGSTEGVAQDDDCGGEGLISGQPVNGVWPEEQQTVTDPTGTGGLVTPRTAAWVAEARKNLGTFSMSCWDAHVWNPTSDHPRGKACDVMVGADARSSSPARARGDQIANWAVKTAGADRRALRHLVRQDLVRPPRHLDPLQRRRRLQPHRRHRRPLRPRPRVPVLSGHSNIAVAAVQPSREERDR